MAEATAAFGREPSRAAGCHAAAASTSVEAMQSMGIRESSSLALSAPLGDFCRELWFFRREVDLEQCHDETDAICVHPSAAAMPKRAVVSASEAWDMRASVGSYLQINQSDDRRKRFRALAVAKGHGTLPRRVARRNPRIQPVPVHPHH